MIIKVPNVQIPRIWEVVKFAALESDQIKDEHVQDYSNSLLIDLLSSKKQVIVRINEGNEIDAVLIVRYAINKISKLKILHFDNFYSWKKTSKADWMSAYQVCAKFATAENCTEIHAISYNPRLWELTEAVDFKETARHYVFQV